MVDHSRENSNCSPERHHGLYSIQIRQCETPGEKSRRQPTEYGLKQVISSPVFTAEGAAHLCTTVEGWILHSSLVEESRWLRLS